jgi:hypothetical protein
MVQIHTLGSTACTGAQENERRMPLVALCQRALCFQRLSIMIYSRFVVVMDVKANAICWKAW